MNKLFTFLLITVITVQSYAQQQYSQVFAKDDYSQLKKNARDQDIENINNLILKQTARQLKEGSYPIQKRLRAYTNYQSPNSLSKRLKTSPYSQYENPTGISSQQEMKLLYGLERPMEALLRYA
ncbi:hypothetical protein [Sphingobacterium sp. IITKGP-BTPF85]|uniref:hypothetical protein n=1 Tax=Sphingobacterium sp. IITKGP-BTPF85 TaxID=1338009 RepID=UPI000429B3A3|nr:hypothetical protein [Sphingobacterium sp. IITKGP-BTPF85]KKX51509.1 hypothetical protein L950_0204910 [Sphingobacterium sp. IITKGP-BTPF85]